MTISFTKMHGTGNDFIIINDMDEALHLSPKQVVALCDRHFGVGADGVILVRPPRVLEADAFMLYYNSDGTTSEMCGNGVRCFAKYVVDHKIVTAKDGVCAVDTLGGVKPVTCEFGDDGSVSVVRVDMGEPILTPQQVPTNLASDFAELDAPVVAAVIVAEAKNGLGVQEFRATTVSMGNPHCVIFLDTISSEEDLINFDIAWFGSLLEVAPEFPNKTNVEFAFIDDGCIISRVWERGCGETLACGTGACATLVAAVLEGRSSRQSKIKVLGGILEVQWAENNHVFLTGPATEVFTGMVPLNL